MGRPANTEFEAKIKAAAHADKTGSDLALELGVERYAVYYHLKRLKLPYRAVHGGSAGRRDNTAKIEALERRVERLEADVAVLNGFAPGMARAGG